MTILKFIQRKTERVPAHVKKHTQRLLLIKQLDRKHKCPSPTSSPQQ